jgi:hypothetical protein
METALQTATFTINYDGTDHRITAVPQLTHGEIWYSITVRTPENTHTFGMHHHPDTLRFHIRQSLMATNYEEIEEKISDKLIAVEA